MKSAAWATLLGVAGCVTVPVTHPSPAGPATPASAATPVACPKLGPASKRDALLVQPDEVYPFIVRADDAALAVARSKAAQAGDEGKPVELPVIGGVSLELRVRDAASLCEREGVEQLWYLHPLLRGPYVRDIKALEYAVRTLESPGVVNMSIGPPADVMPMPGDDLEPIHLATKRAADAGFVVVVAAGNDLENAGKGAMNPYCRPDWVVCVGAATADHASVWRGSARGDPADRRTWPDVVANGVDVVGPWPQGMAKSQARRARDEGNAEFIATVPPEKRDIYTLETGTSQAAAQVSNAAGQIIHYLQCRLREHEGPRDQWVLSLEISREHFDATSRRGIRLAGEVRLLTPLTALIEYRLVEPWRLVKQLIIDTAIPMPGHEPFEVGAGFVSPGYVRELFGKCGTPDYKLAPIKAR